MITDIKITPSEPVTRMKVVVTFMQMNSPPQGKPLSLPEGWFIQDSFSPTVSDYRMLQNRVGRAYCWWMRQAASDASLQAFLTSAPIQIGLLREGDAIRGFFELDLANPQDINLSYFGLFPDAVGQGAGRAFLDAVIRIAWAHKPECLRVNTCNADHPRALPLYRDMGFEPVRAVEEVWDVPQRLGIPIPQRFIV